MPDGHGQPEPAPDVELAREIRALRRKATMRRRLVALAVFGHVLVLVVVVVLPYLRARERSFDARERYARFVACVVDGEPLEDPGLGLPEGARLGYVDVVRRGELGACAEALRAIPPEPIFWILPATRHAERQVRRAVALVDEELDAARGGRLGEAPAEPIPERPWLAIQRLTAAFTLWSREADTSVDLEAPAVRLPAAARALRPERVPVRDRAGAVNRLGGTQERVELTALDERGLSWVRVGGGGVDFRRLHRPRTVAAVLPGRAPTLLWRTADASCGFDRCAGRSMGLATLGEDDVITPAPAWLAAHPESPAAVWLGEGELRVVARAGRDALELRVFDRPDAPTDEGEPPAGPRLRTPLGEGRAARFLAGEPRWLTDAGIVGPEPETLVLSGRFASLRGCGEWLVASGPERRIALRGDVTHALPSAGSLRALDCAEGALLVHRREGEDDVLHRCLAEGCVSERFPGQRVAAALERGASSPTVVVAAWRTRGGAIAIARWAEELEGSVRPAPCFSESGGFCGPALVGAVPGRLLVAGRQREDVLVLESADGRRWQPLAGLR
ncbi:MAG: hypothetical protein AAGH15_15665 [Myxococcota bacterium]